MSKPVFQIGHKQDMKLKDHVYHVEVIDMGEDDGVWWYECKALNLAPEHQHITREFSEDQLMGGEK